VQQSAIWRKSTALNAIRSTQERAMGEVIVIGEETPVVAVVIEEAVFFVIPKVENHEQACATG